MFKKILFILVIACLPIFTFISCSSTEPDVMSKEDGQEIAVQFVKTSPTFVFDGLEETLQVKNTIEVSIPGTWTYVISFDSSHAGYGDRKDQILAQVITPHMVSITVEQGKVTYASIDDKWDILNQEELFADVDPNSDIVSDGSDIFGTITEIDPVSSETVDGRILVELEQPNNTSDKFWVTIEKNTPIY